VNKDSEEDPVSFVGRYSIKDKPEDVAKDILKTLEINPLIYKSSNPILDWINKAELNGIFISRASFIHSRLKLDSYELQGFAIADKFAPFIFVNSDDWNAPQLFTFIHELAHIWVAETGISNNIEPLIRNRTKHHPVELFCNEVAANSLMPSDYMLNLDSDVFSSSKNIFEVAKQIGVSSIALLYRALNLKLISIKSYGVLKDHVESDFKEFLKREAEKKTKQNKDSTNLPIYYPLILNRNGRLFTQIVLDAFRGGFIEPTHASSLLNVKVNNFPKLEAQMFRWM